MTALVTRPAHTPNRDRHAELAGAWLASLRSERTRRAYRGDLLALFAFLDRGDLDALGAERRHIDAWRLSFDGAPSTVARRLAAVSSFYSYAEAEGRLTANPVRRVARPTIDPDHSDTQGLTKDQARDFLAAAREDGPRSYALAALLLFTGARIGEALSADLADVQHDSGHRVLVVTRKGGKRAKIVLPPAALSALSDYLGMGATFGFEVVASTAPRTKGAPLFTTSTGARWAASEAFRTVQRIARKAGIEGRVSPHSLRHTHATVALGEGVPLHHLQDSMGHADPRTTRRYDRARGRLEKSSAYSVAAALA